MAWRPAIGHTGSFLEVNRPHRLAAVLNPREMFRPRSLLYTVTPCWWTVRYKTSAFSPGISIFATATSFCSGAKVRRIAPCRCSSCGPCRSGRRETAGYLSRLKPLLEKERWSTPPGKPVKRPCASPTQHAIAVGGRAVEVHLPCLLPGCRVPRQPPPKSLPQTSPIGLGLAGAIEGAVQGLEGGGLIGASAPPLSPLTRAAISFEYSERLWIRQLL